MLKICILKEFFGQENQWEKQTGSKGYFKENTVKFHIRSMQNNSLFI